MEGNNKAYSSVPPPASLSSSGGPVDFNDALSKARAIAEKLKQQSAAAAPAPPAAGPSYSSSKYNNYHDEHDNKRSTYDSYSRPSFGSGNEPARYGLGSDERKPSSSYGPTASPDVIQEECMVPNHMVGLVIGKGGDNLKKIERMSGAKVQFTGEQTKLAREMIQQVVDDAHVSEASRMGTTRPAGVPEIGAGMSTSFNSGGSNLVITIPSKKVGLVIGRGGETIRDLEERSGAKITVAPEPSSDRPSQRSVNLIGDDNSVQRAKALIDDIVSEDSLKSVNIGKRGGGGGGGFRNRFTDDRESVQVPKNAVGFIIGRGGETVRSLQDQSGARIKVDSSGDIDANERTINIFGSPDAIALAKQLVMEKMLIYTYVMVGYEGYQAYPYAYGSYNQYPAGSNDAAGEKNTAADGSAPAESSESDPSAQPTSGDTTEDQPQQQWTQEAYNQWYQQYYGGQYGAYDPNQAQPEDQQDSDLPPGTTPNEHSDTHTTPQDPPAE
ncbi:hypothetical protein F4703DRAFT_1745507 [Phycomyces blakesleeanus]